MITQLSSPLSDPTAAESPRGRRPWTTALVVVGIIAAAVTALVAVVLVVFGALALALFGSSLVGWTAPAPDAAGAARASATAQAPPAAAHDDASAIAFTQYWATAVQEVFRTGDPDPVRATSTAECPACQAVLAAVTDPSRASRTPSQVTLNVVDAAVVSSAADTTVVHVIVRCDHSVADLGAGAVDVSGLEFEDRITLRWAGDHWLVAAVDGDAWTPVLA